MFIQVIEGRTNAPDELRRQSMVWERELRPGATGYLGSAGGCTADGSFIMIARFEDRAAATRNAKRPEQDAWWKETEACFDGPATVHESEDVHVMEHGRLEDAHFLQVMEGHVTDRAKADELERESDSVLAEVRPDLLGMVTTYFGNDDFADVAFFTSEEEARQAEGRDMPPEMAERFGQWEKVMAVDRYLDIREPWLISGSQSR